MRKIVLILSAVTCLTACNDEKKTDDAGQAVAAAGEKERTVTVTMPYTATYSASFKLGNADYATKVITGSWKDWETNNLDNLRNWVADTVVAFSSDNTVTRGVDSLIADWKRGRAMYTTVLDSISAVVPLYSVDKEHDWVLVAAKEINVNDKGVRDTVWLMENWRFNKDGKADQLHQYSRKTKK